MLHRYHSSTYDVFAPILDWKYKSMTPSLLILRQMAPSTELPAEPRPKLVLHFPGFVNSMKHIIVLDLKMKVATL